LHGRSFCTVRYALAFAARSSRRLVRSGMRRGGGADGPGLTARAGRREAKGEKGFDSSSRPVFASSLFNFCKRTRTLPPAAQALKELISSSSLSASAAFTSLPTINPQPSTTLAVCFPSPRFYARPPAGTSPETASARHSNAAECVV
jgi:hypothetical protein